MEFKSYPLCATGRGLLLALGIVAAVGLLPPAAPAANRGELSYREDAVLVAFQGKAPLAARVAALNRLGLALDAKPQSPYFARVRIGRALRAAGANVKSVLAALRRDPAVRIAEPEYIVHATGIPNDPRFSELWGLNNTGQNGGTPDADIDAPEAWDTTTGSSSVIVAVVDTGVDYTHPDLTENILRDGTGAVVGFDFANNDADPSDDNDHGTHVAGTIGARGNNSVGVTGICHTVKIMPLKFLDAEGSGSSADAILAIDFARTHGARIMNNSWGSGGFSQLLLEAIQRARDAGILIVAAAGNEGLNNDDAPFFPASNNIFTDNVVSVAATDRNDLLASFSNFGQNSVDIAAPGVAILSTTPGDTYRTFSGTSMATPHVSGAAALLLARYPFLTPAQLKARLLFNVDRPSTLAGKVATGRLNVNQALVTDDISPGKPSALTTSGRASSVLLLTWNASGDDGLAGVASQYELRYQTAPITEANFGAANRAANLPKPGPSGSRQSYLLTGLAPNTTYYVALRAVDNVGNVSSLATAGPFSTLATTCLLDDVEGVPQFSGTSPWAVTTEQSASPTHSYTDSPGTFYAANRDISLTQNTAVTLSAGEPLLAFRARTNLEDHFDFLHVEVTADGGATWQRVLSLTGTTDWTYYSVPLTAYSGRSVRVRFRLITDEAIAGDGVWLDDIRICASVGARVSAFDDDVEGTPTFVGPPPWAVTAADSFSPTQSYTDSPGTQYVDNLDSSLTQVSEVSLAGFVPILTFMAKTSLEFGFDLLHVEVSIDGGATWQQQKLVLTGTTNWSQYSVPLARYFGQSVKVRFRLVTDSSVTDDGVLLDDIRIGGEQILPVGVNLPAPPDNLTATGVSSSQIDLAWADNSNNESGFIIERSADGVSFAPVHTVGANVRTYSDAGLTANTFYFHRVRATNAAGDSAYSNVASAATLPAPGGKLKVSRRVNFGRVGVSSSTTRSLLIRNASRTESLDIRVGRPENPYIIESGGGAVTIPPHGRHLVTLRFQPTVGTRFTGSVSIVSGDPARPTASVTLIGRGK